ncbi:MAG: GatB/YqeY domain-containing protein [Alphaproteobacteria bacterium]|jgi:uncharacterized protein|nr:GatB/YqeY domain-containing protein [Alphaproteobacteria bacterium]MBT4083092.1 GatB/YqeY domain-containing protein [Alphaproteobacteria bacterium]MBT4544908.1 GatB/YqeY domain-containing protein [Alphaproteobacteria bacterium]
MRSKIKEALTTAMKAKDTARVSTLRLIMAALKDRDIAVRTEGKPDGIADEDIIGMLGTMIRQRRDSVKMFREGNREELALKEEAEISVIEEFLPRQMDDGEIEVACKGAIAETGAEGIKDMGRVMGEIKSRHAGQMDFGKASAKIKELLV